MCRAFLFANLLVVSVIACYCHVAGTFGSFTMMNMLLAFAALTGSNLATAAPSQPASNSTAAVSIPKIDRFAGRPQARIAFTQQVRNFQVGRDGHDDILYLETGRDRWFRSEINCFGINDPRDAQGLVSLDHNSGFDRFSRVALVGFGHRSTECRLDGLIELTPQEAIELRLVRPRRSAATSPTPAS